MSRNGLSLTLQDVVAGASGVCGLVTAYAIGIGWNYGYPLAWLVALVSGSLAVCGCLWLKRFG